MTASMLIALAVSLVPEAGSMKADFHVLPKGNDANPGTKDAPFASLGKARDAVRSLVKKGLTQDVTVLVRGGTYALAAPLTFGPQDSGTAEHAITYAACPGDKPVISGGRAITGWKKGNKGTWTVELPDVRAGKWSFRQLFADGVRLRRGRFPNGDGLLRVKRVSADVKEIVLDQAPSPGDLAGKDAELVMYQNWSISRVPIVSSQGATVRLSVPMGWIGHGPATTASPHKPCIIENALEFVDEPGEWYLDRKTGVLTYKAAEGENPNDRQFVAPVAEQLVVVHGGTGSPVRDVHFKGLTFAHTAWPLPTFGYLGIQAGHHGTEMKAATYVLPLAIEFAQAVGCTLERCGVRHTGACGVGFGAACQGNRIVGCEFDDIGGNGVVVGWRGRGKSHRIDLAGDASLSADWKDPADAPKDNEVTNCVLHRCGAVNHGCVAVFDAFCVGTKITHNLVAHMPYTGISIGFRWDTSKTTQRDTLVAHNHIHDCMVMLADGGGIYTLGWQPGTVLRGNLIYSIHRSRFAHGGAPNNGIFFDQGTKALHVEGQIIYKTSGKPIRFNQTNKGNLTWKDNHYNVDPSNAAFPKAAVEKAGPQPAFRDMIPVGR